MIKLIGAMLILAASTGVGFHFAGRVADRPGQIRELRSCLSVLRTEIDYGSRTLSEACRRISGSAEGPVGRLFMEIARRLEEADGATTRECVRMAVESRWGSTSLGAGEKAVLLQLGEVLGGSSRMDQLHHLEVAEASLDAEEAKARDDRERYAKMYRTVGFLAGALVVILMY
jgi:stage III sporulation protein AB